LQVQAMVCAACGERYYDRKTMRQHEAAKLSLATNSARLPETGKVLTLQ
jgi:hypothetical protein